MYGRIKKLSILIVFPFLLGSSHWELTQNNINTKDRDYEVIEATTGKKETSQFYAEDPVIETHIATTSAIRKALANEGIDSSQITILLYYDPLAIRDNLPPRMWNSKSHTNTITSPWLDLTKIVTTSGKEKITIRIDATAARMIRDLYFNSEKLENAPGFLSIPSLRESCFLWIADTYRTVKLKSGLLELEQVPKSFDCVPKKQREPLLFLFESSHQDLGSVAQPVIDQLNYYCQNTAREYYSKVYPSLALKGLQVLESNSEPKSKWWAEIFEPAKQTEKCQR